MFLEQTVRCRSVQCVTGAVYSAFLEQTVRFKNAQFVIGVTSVLYECTALAGVDSVL